MQLWRAFSSLSPTVCLRAIKINAMLYVLTPFVSIKKNLYSQTDFFFFSDFFFYFIFMCHGDSDQRRVLTLTFVVFILFPEMQDQPVRSGSTRHCSSSRQGSILHHHFWCTMEARVKENGAEGQFIWIKKTLKSDFFGGGMGRRRRVHSGRLTLHSQIGQIVHSRHVSVFCWSGAWSGCWVVLPSTQEGRDLVVPATCPGKQEHLTVWERSSILFLLQQRWAATTSQVPVLSCDDPEEERLQGKGDNFSYHFCR